MSSRATYSQLSAIHREIREYWQELKRPTDLDLSVWLAEVTLNAARAALRGRTLPKTDPHIQKIGCILASAAPARGKHTAEWFDYVDAALHMCERMLGTKLVQSANKTLSVEIDPTRKRGRPCGAYATPRAIAQHMIQDVLLALRRSTTLDVLDLSTEAGQFPITTVAAAPERMGIRLFAVDRDNNALRLARKLYRFARQQSQSQIPLTLTCRDSLFDPLPPSWPRVFDAVIGNPPWAARRGSYTERVRSAYAPLLTQNFDLYLAFILRADALLRAGGILAMVIPSTFLFNDSGRPVRRYLLEHYDVLTLRVHPRGSIVEVRCIVPVSLVLRKRAQGSRPHASTRIVYESSRPGGAPRPCMSITCNAPAYWQTLAGVPFHPSVRPDIQELLRHLDGFRRLRDFGTVMPGARFSAGNACGAEAEFSGYQARDLRPFHACEHGSIKYTNERRFDRAPKERDIRRRKVLFQDFRFITHSRRLIAAVGEAGTYAVSTASMFVPDEPELTDFWTAILNSAIANAWYKLHDVSRAVKLELIRNVPVPFSDDSQSIVTSMSRQCTELRHHLHQLGVRCTVSEEHLVFKLNYPALFSKICRAQQELDNILFDFYRISRKQRGPILAFSATRVF